MSDLRLDPPRTALVLIDLMPRIIALHTEPISGDQVLERCLALASAMRAAGSLIVFVRAERPGVEQQPAGSELALECAPRPGDVEIVKRTLGAFHQTALDEVLKGRGVQTVALGGLVTNFGVESTGRAADEHGYAVVYVDDAMAGLHARAHAFAVDYVFPRLGTVSTSEQLLAAIG